MEVHVTMSAGNDINGLKITPELQRVIWPDHTDAQTVVSLRTVLRNLLVLLHATHTGQPMSQSADFVQTETVELH